jgi:hypothetical protein
VRASLRRASERQRRAARDCFAATAVGSEALAATSPSPTLAPLLPEAHSSVTTQARAIAAFRFTPPVSPSVAGGLSERPRVATAV